jgi:hypothetical protein
MHGLDSLKTRIRNLIHWTPNQNIFPPEPWDQEDMEEIARIVQNFVDHNHEVIDDSNPWRDWLDRYRFFMATRKEDG